MSERDNLCCWFNKIFDLLYFGIGLFIYIYIIYFLVNNMLNQLGHMGGTQSKYNHLFTCVWMTGWEGPILFYFFVLLFVKTFDNSGIQTICF